MPQTYLVDISVNDDIQDVVRKTNLNFRNVAYYQDSRSTTVARTASADLESTRDTLRNEMENGDDTVRQEYKDADASLRAEIDRLRGEMLAQVQTLKEQLTPPVGTLMFSKNNPGDTYTGTTWLQHSNGACVPMSTDTTYTHNSTWELESASGLQVATSKRPRFHAWNLWERTA